MHVIKYVIRLCVIIMDMIRNFLISIISDKKKLVIISGVIILIVVILLLFSFTMGSNNNYVYGGMISIDDDKYRDIVITSYDKYEAIVDYYGIDKALDKEDFDKKII